MRRISNETIKAEVRKWGSVNGAASALGMSWQTVAWACTGIRKEPKVLTPKQLGEGEKLCSCCHREPVAEGNRFLCPLCYRLAGEGEFEENEISGREIARTLQERI